MREEPAEKTFGELSQPEQSIASAPRSAYLHIPFCRRRCFYCDFPIAVLGTPGTSAAAAATEQYVAAICREIQMTPAGGEPLATVFLGGGTPSLLTAKQLEAILITLAQRFGLDPQAEISMEIDPGTFTLLQLREYRQAGINRVSLGVQAFQEELLQVCGRSHSVTDIFTAVEQIRQVDIPFSLDLISGLPQQTLAQWQDSLLTAIALAPNHLSCYDLVLEPVTVFGKRYQPGQTPLPADETTAHMYRLAQQMLTAAGYEHYEVSNYALPGSQCRHNRVYWENRPYYGFGMGATSYVNCQRVSRPRTRREYYAWVEQLSDRPSRIEEAESATDELLETLMLGLRLAEGISLFQLAKLYGSKVVDAIWDSLIPYFHQGWVEAIAEDGSLVDMARGSLTVARRIRLSDPEGFLFSNTVLAALFNRLS